MTSSTKWYLIEKSCTVESTEVGTVVLRAGQYLDLTMGAVYPLRGFDYSINLTDADHRRVLEGCCTKMPEAPESQFSHSATEIRNYRHLVNTIKVNAYSGKFFTHMFDLRRCRRLLKMLKANPHFHPTFKELDAVCTYNVCSSIYLTGADPKDKEQARLIVASFIKYPESYFAGDELFDLIALSALATAVAGRKMDDVAYVVARLSDKAKRFVANFDLI